MGIRHLSKIGEAFKGASRVLNLVGNKPWRSDIPGLFYFSQNEQNLIFLSTFFCYNLFMRYKSYEADKDGRIYIYPSPDVPGRRIPAILKVFIKKLIDLLRGKGKESPREE